jgi:hypothetical protein
MTESKGFNFVVMSKVVDCAHEEHMISDRVPSSEMAQERGRHPIQYEVSRLGDMVVNVFP